MCYHNRVIAVTEYLDKSGRSPFGAWFSKLRAEAAARVTTALYRLSQGNFSNFKGVGEGVHEYKLDFGPGYRIYFGKDGELLVVLLGGGTKKRQTRDITAAKERWKDYKARKRKEVK